MIVGIIRSTPNVSNDPGRQIPNVLEQRIEEAANVTNGGRWKDAAQDDEALFTKCELVLNCKLHTAADRGRDIQSTPRIRVGKGDVGHSGPGTHLHRHPASVHQRDV
jgi:hypothetical protein